MNALFLIIGFFFGFSFLARGENIADFPSPDGNYLFKLNPLNNDGQRGLMLFHKGKTVLDSSYVLEGEISDVLWNSNCSFVAINNRHSLGGDYVWVFSLPSGSAVKQPDNEIARRICAQVHEQYPKYDYGNLSGFRSFAYKWVSDKELLVCTILIFDDEHDAIVAVYDKLTMGAEGGYLITTRLITKLQPEEFKNLPAEASRIWTGWNSKWWENRGTQPDGVGNVR